MKDIHGIETSIVDIFFRLGKKLRFMDLGDGRIEDKNTQLR